MRAFFVASLLILGSLFTLPLLAEEEPLFVDPRALAAVDQFERTWHATRALTYRIVKSERLRSDKLVVEELAIKYQKPGRAYVRMVRPVKGREMIYDRTKNRKKLTVHNGQFPDLTLNLDIHGMLATNDQHHTIDNLGFDQALHVFRSALAEAQKHGYGERLEYAGDTSFAGRPVHKVVMLTGKRPARSVEAREDESLFDFAARVGQDAYVIYVANPQIRSLHSDLEGGESYLVPPYYAQRCESYHDKDTGMPLKQVMYSGKKLYESYEHYDLVLDAKLVDSDFDAKNPSYGF
jgi:outer membrane lipoprotein-sorting protein